MNHRLKTLPEYFEAVYRRDKAFEVRKNDRDFKVGEGLFLQEWDSQLEMYTGRQIGAEITYILDETEFCKEGYVILGIEIGAASMKYSAEYRNVETYE